MDANTIYFLLYKYFYSVSVYLNILSVKHFFLHFSVIGQIFIGAHSLLQKRIELPPWGDYSLTERTWLIHMKQYHKCNRNQKNKAPLKEQIVAAYGNKGARGGKMV